MSGIPIESRGVRTEALWQDFRSQLRRFVAARVRSPADTDDVLQTVFLKIHEGLDSLTDASRLEPWIFRIARNAVTDLHRKRQRSREDAWPEAGEPPSGDGESPERPEVPHCLAGMIDRLPDDQKRALFLYEIEGVSQKEIAARESISLSGAKSRIQRGRRNLEALIRSCCDVQLDRRGNVVDYTKRNCTSGDC